MDRARRGPRDGRHPGGSRSGSVQGAGLPEPGPGGAGRGRLPGAGDDGRLAQPCGIHARGVSGGFLRIAARRRSGDRHRQRHRGRGRLAGPDLRSRRSVQVAGDSERPGAEPRRHLPPEIRAQRLRRDRRPRVAAQALHAGRGVGTRGRPAGADGRISLGPQVPARLFGLLQPADGIGRILPFRAPKRYDFADRPER